MLPNPTRAKNQKPQMEVTSSKAITIVLAVTSSDRVVTSSVLADTIVRVINSDLVVISSDLVVISLVKADTSSVISSLKMHSTTARMPRVRT